jgi:hypothetical protein
MGDMDGDGDPDLVVGPDNFNGQLRVYANDGAGHFAAPSSVTSYTPAQHAIRLVDLDGDADRDVLRCSRYTGQAFLNDGTGTLTAKFHYNFSGAAQACTIFDWDGDGALDFLVATSIGGFARVYRSTGPGTFTDFGSVDLGLSLGDSAAGDVDGDGREDLLIAPYPNANLPEMRLFKRMPDGSLGAPTVISTMHPQVSGLALVDLNLDGRLDIASVGGNELHLYFQGANGAFFLDATFPRVYSGWNLAVADLDGDTLPDLLTTSYTNPFVATVLSAP